ncbi:MAG: hypothetical protein ACL93V_07400 [Candidatus Electrothrix sp. YB6]
MSSTADTFTEQFPLDFRLYDQDHNSVLYITDNPVDTAVCFSVRNNSQKPVTLKQFDLKNQWADKEHHHFEIVFRKGTLLAEKRADKIRDAAKDRIIGDANQLRLDQKGKARWNIKLDAEQDGDTVSLYVLATHKEKEKEVIEPGEELHITLPNMSAREGTGNRKTRVLFKCRNLSICQEAREKTLNIQYRKGARQLPLHVGFVGSNTILNDGKTENELILRVTNTLNNKDIILNGESNSAPTSRFALWFDIKEEGDSAEAWALANKDKVKAIELTDAKGYYKTLGDKDTENVIDPTDVSDYEIEHSDYEIEKDDMGDKPKWTASFQNRKVLEPGEHIDFYLTHITTSLKTGRANLYLQYQNIPGYWDGRFICNIMKSPLLMRDKRVGIRTDEPEAALHVVGNVKVTRGIEDDKGPIMPKGGIIMWSGAADAIPPGWALCNGRNGTPDLRDRFIVGAGGAYPVQATGGEEAVALTEDNMPQHRHEITVSKDGSHRHSTELVRHYRSFLGGGGDDCPLKNQQQDNRDQTCSSATSETGEHAHTAECRPAGAGRPHENRPPYYALFFIMKL